MRNKNNSFGIIIKNTGKHIQLLYNIINKTNCYIT